MTPQRKPESERPFVEFTPSGKLATHGGSGATYVHYGCRCDKCTDVNRVRIRRRRKERDATTGTFEHGSSGYVNWGCRCDQCRQGAAERLARANLSRRARAAAEAPHGTTSGYQNWGCRCADCCEAHTTYYRDRRSSDGAACCPDPGCSGSPCTFPGYAEQPLRSPHERACP